MSLVMDCPEVAAFFASLPPDPERDRLTVALRTAHKNLASAQAMGERLRVRHQEITAELMGADLPTRRRLQDAWASHFNERLSMWYVLHGSARDAATARAAWAAHVHQQVTTTTAGLDAARIIEADLHRWFPNVHGCDVRERDIEDYAEGVVRPGVEEGWIEKGQHVTRETVRRMFTETRMIEPTSPSTTSRVSRDLQSRSERREARRRRQS